MLDSGLCSYSRGFAQIDTAQDAEWFGKWANPTRLIVVEWTEGDWSVTTCDTPDEFVALIRDLDVSDRRQGHDGIKIDGGLRPDLIAAFEALGLGGFLH